MLSVATSFLILCRKVQECSEHIFDLAAVVEIVNKLSGVGEKQIILL
jgi:hypothetical protein